MVNGSNETGTTTTTKTLLRGVPPRVRTLYARVTGAVHRPTEAGQLLRQVLFFIPLPLPLAALVALMVGGDWSAPGWTILLAGSVAVASLLLAVVVQPTPLPEGLSAEASVRRSLHRFRQITALRIALALTPVVVGAGAAIAGGGLFPLLAALLLAWPQLVLASPLFFTITRARRAMEAWGTKAYLWAALAQPAPVEWPLVTWLAARYRVWRAERDRAAGGGDPREASGGAADGEAADTDATSDTSGADDAEDGSGLPERLAVPSAEPKREPSGLIPGFPVSSSVLPSPARRILRSGGPHRKTRPSRTGPRRKAKN